MAKTEKSDPITGAQAMILLPHYELHEGDMFSCHKYTEAVADDGTVEIRFTTGTKPCHVFVTGTSP